MMVLVTKGAGYLSDQKDEIAWSLKERAISFGLFTSSTFLSPRLSSSSLAFLIFLLEEISYLFIL